MHLLTTPNETDWIQAVAAIVAVVVGFLGVVASTVVAIAAVMASRAANRATVQSAAASAQAVAIAKRAERAQYGAAVQAYFDSRKSDLFAGKNWNMPHYAEGVRGMARQLDDPNAGALFAWLTKAMDHINRDQKVDEDQGINAHFLRMQLPGVVGDWVRDPAGFAPEPFRLNEELDPFDAMWAEAGDAPEETAEG